MPPRIKTDRTAIVSAAFQVAENEGITAITAQRVAAVLDTSVAPIFREFQTIEELRTAAAEQINAFHTEYIKNYTSADSGFLTCGIAYIHFAKEYPCLFETIMQPGRTSMNDRMSSTLAFAVNLIASDYALSIEQAKELFFNVWIYTHGIACLVYKGSLSIGEEEEKKLLADAFAAFYEKYK